MGIDFFVVVICNKHIETGLKECTVTRVHSSYPWGREKASGREAIRKGTVTFILLYFHII